MKIAVVGAGAIGGWIGLRLAQAGCHVSVLARADSLAAIGSHGLRLNENAGTYSATVRASDSAHELGPQDLVILAVKAPSLAQVAPSLGPLIGQHTMVLTAMNGVPWWFFDGFGGAYAGTRLQAVDPDGSLAHAVAGRHIIGCVVHASCSLRSPGYVQHHFGNKLIIGEPSGQKTERVLQLAALLTRAGFEAPIADQIQQDTWYKLWGNMTVNPISALTGATTDLILGDPLVRQFASAVMLEAKEIGARLGIPIAQQPADRHAVTLKLGAFKTSMLQDLENDKPLELDALVAVVRELGTLTGVATPHTDTLLGLARLQAQVRGLYPVGSTMKR
jgi:2-dehydropantoate 2-reductase